MHPCAALLRVAPFLARLACFRHAASVRSEPGSNSPIKFWSLDLAGSTLPAKGMADPAQMNCLVSTYLRVHLLFSFQRPSVPLLRLLQRFLHRGRAFYANLRPLVKRPSLDFFGVVSWHHEAGPKIVRRDDLSRAFGPQSISVLRFGFEPRDICGTTLPMRRYLLSHSDLHKNFVSFCDLPAATCFSALPCCQIANCEAANCCAANSCLRPSSSALLEARGSLQLPTPNPYRWCSSTGGTSNRTALACQMRVRSCPI